MPIAKGFHTVTEDNTVKDYQLGDRITIVGDDKNLTTDTTSDGKLHVRMKDHISVSSITTGNISVSTTGINAGDTKITNVADGDISENSTDAVNGSQVYKLLNQAGNNSAVSNQVKQLNQNYNVLEDKVNKLDKKRKAGNASAIAASALPQAFREGQSGFVAGVGQYQSQTAIAVGYTTASDNGKLLLKTSVTTNTQGEVGGNIGLGYFW